MKEIYIERQKELLRIAIRRNNKLEACFIEEETKEPVPGEIYKGIVKNVVPAIKSAFIDIGYTQNCYMHLDSKLNKGAVKPGMELLVEVVKEGLGKKGAKVTNAFSIPGTYAVIITLDKQVHFSKKIEDTDFIKRIKEELWKPEDVGVMIRTNAQYVDIEALNKEIQRLYEAYKEVVRQGMHTTKPKLLFKGAGVLGQTLRDMVDEHTAKLIFNDEEDFQHAKQFIANRIEVHPQVELHNESRSLLDFYGIEKEILSLRNNKVPLHCGGHIVIDRTEAMFVIDVNSGKNIKGHSLKRTAYVTNMEAAAEIAKQIRLRNLSGIILIDFIDVEEEEMKQSIINTLYQGFQGDKNKTVVYPFTQLNLVQIARSRRGKSIYDYIEEPCNYCSGKGKRIKLSYIEFLLRNEIGKINKEQGIKDIYIEMDKLYEKDIRNDVLSFVQNIDALDKVLYLNFISHMEYFKVEPILFANQIRNLQMFKIYG